MSATTVSVFKKSSFAPSDFPKINNVNISFKISTDKLSNIFDSDFPLQSHNNIHIIRDPEIKKRVYTVFRSGHINITGLPTFRDISDGLSRFNTLFNQTVAVKDITVNNSTASGRLYNDTKFLNFQKIKEEIKKHSSCDNKMTFNFRPHYFPGAILRRKNKSTIILFCNGKYNIIGSKDRLSVREAHRFLNVVIRNIK